MNEVYPEDCISLSRDFVQPLHRSIFPNPSGPVMKRYCTATGLFPGEIERLLESPFGTMSLQPSIWRAIDLGNIAFMPPDYVMRSLIELYDYNYAHSLHNRRRVDIPNPSALVYAALGSSWLEGAPIFTRHPRTCVVTTHLPPYTTLPYFSLRTIHPSLLAVRARLFVSKSDLSAVYPLVDDLALHSGRHVDPVFQRNPNTIPSSRAEAETLQPVPRKRKFVDSLALQAKRRNIVIMGRSPPAHSQRPRIPLAGTDILTPNDGLLSIIRGRTYYPRSAKNGVVTAKTA
ncbi:hypothetical protein CYLTODRAFT_493491 [Cylindrobasidium torrendii FP15055 ss-10]|uniref:Uncharacterized protein n=1 Tax=Cylindrobasidium torrendii FP15055 ss-10 TaxID=1314674 RepID=A0A0D7B0I4_9AGAR|nr:hypothetical protein CYLTODRAFT_493491 [Cylindrobasidium torrendii FP15055 ss-10]